MRLEFRMPASNLPGRSAGSQRRIVVDEMAQAASEPTPDVGYGNIMRVQCRRVAWFVGLL